MSSPPFCACFVQLDHGSLTRGLAKVGPRRAHVSTRSTVPQKFIVRHTAEPCPNGFDVDRQVCREAVHALHANRITLDRPPEAQARGLLGSLLFLCGAV